MKINELASEYKMQYEILRAKIDGLRPLLRIYDGTDLVLLRKKIKTYYDMASECRITYLLLSDYYPNYKEDEDEKLY